GRKPSSTPASSRRAACSAMSSWLGRSRLGQPPDPARGLQPPRPVLRDLAGAVGRGHRAVALPHRGLELGSHRPGLARTRISVGASAAGTLADGTLADGTSTARTSTTGTPASGTLADGTSTA